jgi:UDP:flavonoid glycosyltransferase YjiC (YdhE family)
MKILIASSGASGHLNPLLAVANILIRHGHEVLVQTAPELQPAVEAAGVPFRSESPETKSFIGDFITNFPERQQKTPGMEMTGFDLEHYFAQKIPAQAQDLKIALRSFPADVVIADSWFWGTLPMLLQQPRDSRPAVIHLGISVLNLCSGKNIPPRPGSNTQERRQEQETRERLFLKPTQAAVNRALGQLGCRPLPCPALEAMSILPDLYLHPGIESFEYPDQSPNHYPDQHVRYIGALPLPAGKTELPCWWNELDMTKRLVLVTQGTLANWDLGQLIGPTITGLANEKDLIVLVTTGGQPIESIPVELPENVRAAKFLPFELIFPMVDLLVTNGGYGTVNQALKHGIPVVTAGLTEDKEEVSAHVQWAGVGIDLRTSQPTPQAVRAAAREALTNSSYRGRAHELAAEFASHNPETELLDLIYACTRQAVEA